MSEFKAINSQCLCGTVKISVAEVNPNFTVCHCDSCRAWSGAPYFALQCGTDVSFENADKIKTYKSSAWASRGFCSECGTHLFYKLDKTGAYNMPVGLFQQLTNLTMDMQYFSDQRPNYYCLANKTKEMTRAEIMEFFSPQV